MAKKRARFHPLAVRSVERLTDDALALTFDVPDDLAEAYAHSAGQHVAIVAPALDDGERRSFSICTPAGLGSAERWDQDAAGRVVLDLRRREGAAR